MSEMFPGLVVDGVEDPEDENAEPEYKVTDPFTDEHGRGKSKRFEITTPINLGQLQDEIEEALGFEVRLASSAPRPFEDASEDNLLTLFVDADEDVDGRTVRGAIDSHRPSDPTATVPEAKAPAKVGDLDEDTQAAIAKLGEGETLSTKEISKVLKVLLDQG